jgi:pSer/pThr/pTyr-binding forkhead associated (FHA) protein
MHDYRLKGASGKMANQSFRLHRRTVIGTAPGCELRVEGDKVAPQHAEICLDEAGGLLLRDLGSGYETRVNGNVVNEVKLNSGDEIRLGNFRWVLQAPGLRPEKVLTPAAVKRTRSHLLWLIPFALLALAALAWLGGWLPL